ncbi:hypothetical protein J2786_003600 [Chryseobacterium vietnamense]|uniref:Uncharacterized protein n=1 Tax=Chryseobacterium vietnamense TaxID=866785 RepID=A0ACC6JBZ2_9FLAO|nr:hypothetical protein [Chryseobacterium vietnamense]MDR6460466.1 hypothetical protein [Chryseobacterium vietnamense]
MNNTVKIALALAAGSSLLYMGLRKRIKQKKVYLAPDGNTYKENQIYRTYDNKLYKNGKEFHYNLPDQHDELTSNMKSIKVNKNSPLNYSISQKNTAYHHKGVRHH